jgi:hypothetical protein
VEHVEIISKLRLHDPQAVSIFCSSEVKGNEWWMQPAAMEYLKYGDAMTAPDVCAKCIEVIIAERGATTAIQLLRESMGNPVLSQNLAIGAARTGSTAIHLLRSLAELRLKPHVEVQVLRNVVNGPQLRDVRLDREDQEIIRNRASLLLSIKTDGWPSPLIERKSKAALTDFLS